MGKSEKEQLETLHIGALPPFKGKGSATPDYRATLRNICSQRPRLIGLAGLTTRMHAVQLDKMIIFHSCIFITYYLFMLGVMNVHPHFCTGSVPFWCCLSIVTVVSINEVFNQCIFQSMHFSKDADFQSMQFFNRFNFSIDPIFQSIHFFNRSSFSIDPIFNRSSFSIDAVFPIWLRLLLVSCPDWSARPPISTS